MNRVIHILLSTLLLFSSFKIIDTYFKYQKDIETYNQIKNIHEINNESSIDNDFQEINSDYKLWIEIKGTNINYPVVQGKDNLYYLTHDFYGEKNTSGTLFIDFRNNIDKDTNTIIYGHNMKNKTMFNNLNNFKDQSFLDLNNEIRIQINNKEYIYKIFSVYTSPKEYDYRITDFGDKSTFIDYLTQIKKKSIIHSEINVTEIRNIITLSTCSYEFNNARTVVHATRLE